MMQASTSLYSARRMAKMSAALLALALAAGCATGDPSTPGEDEDASMDMGTQTARDMNTTPPVDMRPPPPDMAPEEMAPPMICTPGMQTCVDTTTLKICSGDGARETMMICPEGKECEDGLCVTPQLCEPGSALCFDQNTRQICRDSGMAYKTEPCPMDSACVQGECQSGEVNGSSCVSADDCSGGRCHCGMDEGCADAFATPSYCTSECGSGMDCGENEWCFASDVHLIEATDGNYNHCIARCQGTCTLDGFVCKQVPVYDDSGALSWEEGCYFDGTKELGEDCESDVECLSGTCLKDYYTKGFCSRRCETDTCPDDAACVELIPGEAWCTQLCGDGSVGGSDPCPKDQPDDRLDVTCSVKQLHGGGVKRVCTDT